MKFIVGSILFVLFLLILLVRNITDLGISLQSTENSIESTISKTKQNESFIFSHFNQPTWFKNGDEFIHNGMLYDVVKKDTSNQSIIVVAHVDVRETLLLTLYQHSNKTNKHKYNHYIAYPPEYYVPHYLSIRRHVCSPRAEQATNNFIKVETPPPEFFRHFHLI